ncbi:MAG: hypothetical protein KME06_04695 [Kastovskya adunca ATA6-11-RM4]|jgi:hypothetical protein|nr:hypothetical protein [Kastovskya adunca ATA6-11-RM4]
MSNNFKPLDVTSEHKDTVVSFSSSMFKASDFFTVVKESLKKKGLDELRIRLDQKGGIPGDCNGWYVQGVSSELLQPGTQGWIKGKLRINISLEFCPNEPEISEPEARFDDVR